MNLTEAIEGIFGKVNFKNTKELNNIARKLESLFSKKGLDPKTLDDFLTKLDLDPSDFKTSEAVRQIATKKTGANTKGLSISEILQQVSSAVITPKAIQDISIATGLSSKILDTIIKNTTPSVRSLIIKSILEE